MQAKVQQTIHKYINFNISGEKLENDNKEKSQENGSRWTQAGTIERLTSTLSLQRR